MLPSLLCLPLLLLLNLIPRICPLKKRERVERCNTETTNEMGLLNFVAHRLVVVVARLSGVTPPPPSLSHHQLSYLPSLHTRWSPPSVRRSNHHHIYKCGMCAAVKAQRMRCGSRHQDTRDQSATKQPCNGPNDSKCQHLVAFLLRHSFYTGDTLEPTVYQEVSRGAQDGHLTSSNASTLTRRKA